MNPNHAATIKARYLSAIALNDVDAFDELMKIRKRAKQLNYTEDQLQQVYREARDEKRNIQHNDTAVPEPEPPESTPEPRKKESQAITPKQRQKLSERVTASYEPVPELNPSGGKARKSKISILDLADNKQCKK